MSSTRRTPVTRPPPCPLRLTGDLIQDIVAAYLRHRGALNHTLEGRLVAAPGTAPMAWLQRADECRADQQWDAGVASCVPCPACVSCPPGTFADGARCVPCPKGHYSPVKGLRGACIPCQEGYADEEGLARCKPCYNNSGRAPGTSGLSAEGCRCYRGYYSNEPTACVPCPTGALCEGGLARPIPRRGYWGQPECVPGHLPGNGTRNCSHWDLILECPLHESCAGDFRCSVGHAGRLCQGTADGYFVVGRQLWVSCKVFSSVRPVQMLLTLLAVVAVVAIWVGINKGVPCCGWGC